MEDQREGSHEVSSRFSDKSGDNRFTELGIIKIGSVMWLF